MGDHITECPDTPDSPRVGHMKLHLPRPIRPPYPIQIRRREMHFRCWSQFPPDREDVSLTSNGVQKVAKFGFAKRLQFSGGPIVPSRTLFWRPRSGKLLRKLAI
jgi:hypothetical protein